MQKDKHSDVLMPIVNEITLDEVTTFAMSIGERAAHFMPHVLEAHVIVLIKTHWRQEHKHGALQFVPRATEEVEHEAAGHRQL